MHRAFDNGIELRDHDVGILVKQFNDAYVARNWQITDQTIQLVQTAIKSGLHWMIRDGHPRANALWPSGKGTVYLAFSPTRENQWSVAIDSFSESRRDYGHAVFNGKYRLQFEQLRVPFEFEKRNRRAGHMVVSREHVLSTIRLLRDLDHRVLYLRRSEETVDGFATEYDIQHALLFNWDRTPFAEYYDLVIDEFPVDLGQNPRRIDILAKEKASGGKLVIEIKRAEANQDSIRQIRGYLHALRRRSDFRGNAITGALVAERIPSNVRADAKRYAISAYEIKYPLEFSRVA